ncbi:MAG: DUF2442 domain-containing protein [Bacteroidales bacterium]|nr:DUF2442 domain-containing protein [Bacteroidales bacterium]
MKVVWIKSAKYIKDYKIKVIFEDKTEKIIDIKPFLLKTNHPGIKEFLDIDKFKTFSVQYGGLHWEGNQFDLSPEGIYKGEFDVKPSKKRNIKKSKTLIK